MSNIYKKLMLKAQREKIDLANGNTRLLAKLYKEVAKDIQNRLKNAKGGFTRAWLKDFSKYIDYRYAQLNDDLYSLTEKGIKTSAQIAATVEGDFLSYISNRYNLDIPSKYIDSICSINQDAILRILSGSMYENSLGVKKSIWKYSEKNKGDLNYIIARGLAEQKDFKSICDDLVKYVDPSQRKDYAWKRLYPNASNKTRVDYNAQRLLRTSINHAFFNQNIYNAKRNPYAEGIQWELSAEHFNRQVKRFGPDVCDDYAGQDNYGLGRGVFPVDKVPIPHACCMCYQYSVITKDLDEIADDLNAWIHGEENELLDKWLV